MPDVSVIVPARNAAHTIGRTLAALGAQDLDRPFETIVVDDGSGDDTVARVRQSNLEVQLLSQDGRGPAAARNLGAAHARGGLLAFTDADCEPEPSWLRRGLEALAGADLVQGVVIPDPARPLGPFDRTISVTREHGLYETANLLVTGELFEALGGFEDWLPARLGKPLAEDVWFGWRARRAGARITFCEDAIVRHAVFPRGPLEYAAERSRLVYFPAMVAQVPELRDHFLYRRWFLNRRTALFDLAVIGAVGALAATPRRRRRALACTALALPYAGLAVTDAARWRRRAPVVLAGRLLADAVGLVALAFGSAYRRSVVL